MAEFTAYLDRDGAGSGRGPGRLPPARGPALREELLELIGAMREAIVPVLSHEPRPDRAQYLLSPIHFPIEEAPGT